jgi:hypothetical protein
MTDKSEILTREQHESILLRLPDQLIRSDTPLAWQIDIQSLRSSDVAQRTEIVRLRAALKEILMLLDRHASKHLNADWLAAMQKEYGLDAKEKP